jgi:hypothetical protein
MVLVRPIRNDAIGSSTCNIGFPLAMARGCTLTRPDLVMAGAG